MTESEVKYSKLLLPPAQVCSGGIERIKEFFLHPEQKGPGGRRSINRKFAGLLQRHCRNCCR